MIVNGLKRVGRAFRRFGVWISQPFRSPVRWMVTRVQKIQARLFRITFIALMARTMQGVGSHDGSHMAAGVAYYALLSIFPLLIGLISILGFILPSENIQKEIIDFVDRNLPGASGVLTQNINEIILLRGTLGIIAIVGLFWTASALFGAITRIINRASHVERMRPFYLRKPRDIGMALSIGVLFLLSFGLTTLASIIERTNLPGAGLLTNVGGRVLSLALAFAIFLLLYKLIPNRKTYWRYVWSGAALAAVAFEAAKFGFVLYLARYANYRLAYGSIGSVVAFLVFLYIAAYILTIGAEFSYQYQQWHEERAKAGNGAIDGP